MSKKTFIMLAAPGMIGKTFAADHIVDKYPSVEKLENDFLMHRLFEKAGLTNPTEVPINEVEKWREEVNANTDCDALIRDLHCDWISNHNSASLVLAEGYLYMCQWYRDQVRQGINALGYEVNYHLLQYYPPLNEQAIRRAKKYAAWSWGSKPYDFHEKELVNSWSDFQVPSNEPLNFEVVNDDRLMEIMEQFVRIENG